MEAAVKVFLARKQEQKSTVTVVMIVTGGAPGQNEDNTTSEAAVMKNMAVKAGVPSSSIILEDKALTTIENAWFVKEILENLGIDIIDLVTSDFHMNRSSKIFRAVLGSDASIQCIEDHPTLSTSDRKIEECTEQRMLARLDQDLISYL